MNGLGKKVILEKRAHAAIFELVAIIQTLLMEETNNYYEVVVRKRVPYLTVFLYRLFAFFVICSLLVYLIMYPTKYAPNEMALAYYNLVLPELIRKFILFSMIGLFISGLLYLEVRLYKSAIITFETNQINIVGKSINLTLKIYDIKKVTFMDDSKEVGGQLREKFMVYFQQRMEKSIRLRLEHYVQAEEFMNEFLKYDHLEYEFLNIDFSPDLENEI